MTGLCVCLLLLCTAPSRAKAEKEGEDLHILENATSIVEKSSFKGTSTGLLGSAWSLSFETSTIRGLLSTTYQPRLKDEGQFMRPPEKRTKTKLTLDNNTGLRKAKSQQAGVLSEASNTNVQRSSQDFDGNSHILQHGGTSVSTYFRHRKSGSLAGSQYLKDPNSSRTSGYNTIDYESNRPGKINPQKYTEAIRNVTKPSWITNRYPSSLLYQFTGLKKDSDSKEKTCLTDCNKERDEKESYCNSEFVVNGIVHDVETLNKGTQLITLLVNSNGLYKMNRLYITPDGFFFRIKILAVDTMSCHKSCLDFKLGSRYIVMGQIYHKRMELPQTIQQMISGRLRAGDGILKSSNYVRRFNRKRDRKVLMATHAKCR
ncbi:UPF0450 protein C17orf58 homolog [Discoglossus pictus]